MDEDEAVRRIGEAAYDITDGLQKTFQQLGPAVQKKYGLSESDYEIACSNAALRISVILLLEEIASEEEVVQMIKHAMHLLHGFSQQRYDELEQNRANN